MVLTSGPLVINEIMYQSASGDPAEEFIELYNPSTPSVDLTGWRLAGGVDFSLPSVSLAMGEYLVIAADTGKFATLYPTVTGTVGPWTGQLSDAGEDILLLDDTDAEIDAVHYANSGDWALRMPGPTDNGHEGWIWAADHAGGGKSVELRQAAMSNESGQNWASSTTELGTPKATNSTATADLPPIVLDVNHWPPVPTTTESVTVTARLVDESPATATATVQYRIDGGDLSWTPLDMFDDGTHGDGAADDGVFGAVIPAQAVDGGVVEFFIDASDAGTNDRAWPAANQPGDQHDTNLLYQVDDLFAGISPWTPGTAPQVHLVMTEAERLDLEQLGADLSDSASNAQMNGTLVYVDGLGVDVRYNVGVRVAGDENRDDTPNSYRVTLPDDQPWRGVRAVDLNTKYPHAQLAGGLLFQAAGLLAPDVAAVQVHVNGADLSAGDPARTLGAYAQVEALDEHFGRAHYPNDGEGNLYRAVRIGSDPPQQANLAYFDDNASSYQPFYEKISHVAENNWSDLIALIDVLNNEPVATFAAQLDQIADVDQWLRHLAVETLLGNAGPGLNSGQGNNFAFYRRDDGRFLLIPQDLSAVLGQGAVAGDPNDGIFGFEQVAGLSRLLDHDDYAAGYYGHLANLISTTFAPAQIATLLDNALGGWANAELQEMKDFVAERVQHVATLIPTELTVDSDLSTLGEFAHTTDATEVLLSGQSHAVATRSVTVNGVDADWDAQNAAWSLDTLPLNPGVNRLIVQALDGDDSEIAREVIDVWYDDGDASGSDGAINVFSFGEDWKYLDDGSNGLMKADGVNWFAHPDYDDSAWPEDAAQLGYGDGDEQTVVNCGPSAPNCNSGNHITTYFRKTFDVTDAAAFTGLRVDVVRDDGVAVYLNGEEIGRNNLIASADWQRVASSTISGSGEVNPVQFVVDLATLPAGTLKEGANVLAAEIHQRGSTNPDISFDLSFSLTESTSSNEIVWTAANGPYHLTSNFVVPAAKTLTIEPGTSVYFDQNVQMIVNGTLIAEGTEYQRIRFTSVPNAPHVPNIPTGSTGLGPGPPRWDGILFSGTMSPENRIVHADIEYAEDTTGAIGAVNSEVLIDNVTFLGTHLRMVYAANSNLIIRNSVFPDMFTADESPDALRLDNESEHIKGQTASPANGHFIIENNIFGTNKGHNDVIDVQSRQRPQAILQVLNNVFLGAGDEQLDLGGDAYIAGNLFMNIYKDDETSDRGYANSISTGDAAQYTTIGLARNIFWEVDHAINLKKQTATIFENNTVVSIHDDFFDRFGHPVVGSAINLYVDEQGATSGWGAYAEGNIFWDAPRIFGNADLPGNTVSVLELYNNFIEPSLASSTIGSRPGTVLDLGTGNILGNPHFVQQLLGNFQLDAGSEAVATGPFGQNFGALVPEGVWITGEPPAVTNADTATLTFGGPGIMAMKYRINGGDWSAEIPIGAGFVGDGATVRSVEVQLDSLADGPYTIEAIGQDFAGVWQDEASPTTARPWTVDTSGPPPVDLVINEILASAGQLVSPLGTTTDLIELFNRGAGIVQLEGLRLTNDPAVPDKFEFPVGTSLAPGEHLVLYADDDAPVGGELHLGFSLDRLGDSVYLLDAVAAGGEQLDAVQFGPQLADYSIGRLPSGVWGLAQPTFGEANISQPLGNVAALKINEWFVDGQFQVGQQNFEDDFIELYNPEPLPVALGGLYLTDDPAVAPGMHQIAALSFIDGIGHRVFTADTMANEGPTHVNFELEPSPGWIGLMAADLSVIDLIHYGPQTSGISQGRVPTGGTQFEFFAQPSPDLDGTPPSVPMGLTFTAISDTQIDIIWNPSTDAETGVAMYRVFRDDVEIGTTTDTTYSDTTATIGNVYLYAVSAVNGDGFESDKTATISSDIDITPPSVPTGLIGMLSSPTQVDLSWNESTDAESGVSLYTVYRDGVEIGTSPTTNFSDTTAPANETAIYQVSASNSGGIESDASLAFILQKIQDGTSPSNTYAGTRDTWIRSALPDSSAGGTTTTLRVDGEVSGGIHEELALIRWDLAGLFSPGTVVHGAWLTIYATDAADDVYDFYEAKQEWSETQATWNHWDKTLPSPDSLWQTPGAAGENDRGESVAQTPAILPIGSTMIELDDVSGVALVQSWIDNPTTNFGLILANPAEATSGFTIVSSENGNPLLRPRLMVSATDVVAPVITVTPALTNDRRPQLTGTVNDPTATIMVTVAGNDYLAINHGDGTWTLPDDTITSDLVDAIYDVTAVATDPSGNSASDATADELTVENIPPFVTVEPLATTDSTPALGGTIDDPTATIVATVNGADYPIVNPGDGSWTLPDDVITPALADGVYEVVITATDLAGNVATDLTDEELRIDTLVPVVTVESLLTSQTSPALGGLIDDPTAEVIVTVDGSDYEAVNDEEGNWTLAADLISPALSHGIYEIGVVATDAAGNVGTDDTNNELAIDTMPPSVSVDPLTTIDTTPPLSGEVEVGASVEVTVGGATYPATNHGDGTWTLADNVITPGLIGGTYNVTATATDSVGNVGVDDTTGELFIDLDTTPPTIPQNLRGTLVGATQVNLTWDASTDPDSGVSHYTIYRDGVEIGTSTTTTFNNSVLPAAATFTYEVTANNAEGVESTKSARLVYRDLRRGYSDTKDTWLDENFPATEHGAAVTLEADGQDSQTLAESLSLLYWDTSSIPANSELHTAAMVLNITNSPSGQQYPLFSIEHDWSEDEATWLEAATGVDWGLAGAKEDTGVEADRGTDPLGLVATASLGQQAFPLNAAGVSLLQDWVDGIKDNYGLIIVHADESVTNGFQFPSGEGVTPNLRPRLLISYTPEEDLIAPTVTVLEVNENAGQGPDSIDGSAAGIQTITVRFTKPMAFSHNEGAVTVEAVTFDGGQAVIGAPIIPDDIAGRGSDTMTITLPPAMARNTWLRISLPQGDALTDTVGNPLSAPASYYVGSLTGDTNGDLQVDATDLSAIFSGSGPSGGFAAGEFTGDGLVNAIDLAHLLANWGMSLDPLPVPDAAVSATSIEAADRFFAGDTTLLDPGTTVSLVVEPIAEEVATTTQHASPRRTHDAALDHENHSRFNRLRLARRPLQEQAVDAAVETISPVRRRRR